MFGRLIEDCCRQIERARGGWRLRLGFPPTPLRMDPGQKVSRTLRPHYQDLLREGEVVWGHVVMANRALWSPGPGGERPDPRRVVRPGDFGVYIL
jgi:hypothetical protein